MPKAVEQEDNEGITDDFPFTYTTTTQRDIDVISKPCCQRYMPPAPKLSYIARGQCPNNRRSRRIFGK